MHATVAGLCPPSLFTLFAAELVYSNATIHATREDSSTVSAANEIQAVRVVAVHTLRQGICSSIPKLELTIRVARDNVAIGQTSDLPDQSVALARGTRNACSQAEVAQKRTVASVVDTDRAVGEAGDDCISVLPSHAHASSLAVPATGQESLEDKVVVFGRENGKGAVACASDQVLATELVLTRGLAGSPSRLGGKTPHLAEVASRRAQLFSCQQIPLGHSCCRANAEQAQLAENCVSLIICVVRLLNPCQSIYASL